MQTDEDQKKGEGLPPDAESRRKFLRNTGLAAATATIAASGALGSRVLADPVQGAGRSQSASTPGSLLPSASDSASGYRIGQDDSRPNLILYFPDTLRADAIAAYGNPICKTPNFDKFAQQGTLFENCHDQFPVCGQSRCSLLSGWPGGENGHRSLYYPLQSYEPNMFRYLKEGGYDVFWFGFNGVLSTQALPSSVTYWNDPHGSQVVDHYRPGAPDTFIGVGGFDPKGTTDYARIQEAIKVLARKGSKRPFCIFLPTGGAHPPYAAPKGFERMYDPASIKDLIPWGLPKRPIYESAIRKAYDLDGVPKSVFKEIKATYYGMMSYVDWLFGELLKGIDHTGHAGDTAVFVGSDHGDYTGDYGLVEKWPSGLEHCLTHVPLIARIPGGVAGHRVRDVVELYDIMGTFLDLAGVRPSQACFARSLVPQLKGAAGDPKRVAYVHGGYNTFEPYAFEYILDGHYGPKTHLQNEHPSTIRRATAAKTADFSYVLRPGGQSEFYDLRHDPNETKNLIDVARYQPKIAELGRHMLEQYLTTSGVNPPIRGGSSFPPYHGPSFVSSWGEEDFEQN